METSEMKHMRLLSIGLGATLATLLAAAPAHAQDAQEDVSFQASTDDVGEDGGDDDSSAFLAAGKIGGIVPFAGFTPFVTGGVELGWIFGGTGRRIGALLDVTYTTPKGDGTVEDTRYEDGGFSWELVQKQLVFQPTFLYRLTGVAGDLVPYAGIGPRIYLLETNVEGTSGGEVIQETHETSTKFGVGVPLGLEYALGPGGLMAELLFQWAPIDHRITGDTNLGSASLFLGYRALL